MAKMYNFNDLRLKTIDIVRKASRIMTSGRFDIYEKHGVTDIVTSSDLAVQHFLEERLTELLPDSGFFCEEEELRQTDREYIWIIDPIDGTANYARGIPECCISVALSYRGEISVGVVYNPYLDYMFSASKGDGAWLNEKPIRVSDKPFNASMYCTALSLYNKDYAPECLAILEQTYAMCNDFRRLGSCAMELCYLAAGICDLYFEIRLSPWDYAASYIVLKEAGGVISELDGEPLSMTMVSPVIAANSEENHRILTDIVKKHVKEVTYERKLT